MPDALLRMESANVQHRAVLAYDIPSAASGTTNHIAPDVLGVQEVGDREARQDLAKLLNGDWHTVLSSLADSRRIRVGFRSRHPLTVAADIAGPLEALE